MPRLHSAIAVLALITAFPLFPETAARRVWGDSGTNILGQPSPDGRYLSCVDPATGDLALLDLLSGEKRRLTGKRLPRRPGEFAYFSAFSPDSRRIAYAWFNERKFYELRLVGTEGGDPRVLFRNEEAGFVQPCAWSPDGRTVLTLLFRKDNISQIALVSAADGSVRILKSLNWVYPKKMDFSPDGRFIVYDSFGRDASPERDLYLLSADGSREHHLVDHPANDQFPIWTPGGDAILFASDRTGTMDLWMVRVAEGRADGPPELVKSNLGRFLPMGMTRKGAFFYGLRAGSTDVYVAGFDIPRGRVVQQPDLASKRMPGTNSSPEWSPDGRQLAYLGRAGSENYGEAARVVTVRSLETGKESALDAKLAHVEWIQWSPDGRFFLAGGSDRRSRGGLYRLDVETGGVSPLVMEDAATFRGLEGAWSRDGKSVIYVSTNSEIRIRELETQRENTLHRPTRSSRIRKLSPSPDGRWLAFVNRDEEKPGEENLCLMPAAGGPSREISGISKKGLIGIEWTPDGRQLCIAVEVEGKFEIWSVALEGEKVRKLELPADWQGGFRIHPDGGRIAYTAGKMWSEVWVMEDFRPAAPKSK